MNESKANNKINNFSEFCRSKSCPEYIEWDCSKGMCESCKLVGQSYYVNEYPKDCLHLKDITLYEAGKLVLPIHDVSKRYLFWFKSEGKDGWTFEIEAEDSNDAYDKAYDTHGPQVAEMMYQVI